jgi:hypothetical protein
LYNLRLLLKEALGQEFYGNPGFCVLRKIVTPNSAYTSCANCEYDDFGGAIRHQQLQRVLTQHVEIKGSVWMDNASGDSGWHREPHSNVRWNYDEWQQWNAYVRARYPQLGSQIWLTDM